MAQKINPKKKNESLGKLMEQIEKKRSFSGKDFNSLSKEEKERMVKEGFKSLGKPYDPSAVAQVESNLKSQASKGNSSASKPKKQGGIMGFIKSFMGSEI